MRFSITYTSEYRYEAPVTDQHNAVRIKPASSPTQTVEDFEFVLNPRARLFARRDYFETEVIEFGVSEAHDRLEIRASARVSTEPPPVPADVGWNALDTTGYRDRGAEFMFTGAEPDVAEAVERLASEARGDSPLDTVRRTCSLVPDRFEYRTGATYVDSSVADLLRGGAGVCQDFVHLALLLLRHNGVAARYVSGYLFAPADHGDRSAEVETHAWLEALVSAANGDPEWVGADPTNRSLATDRHVKIGHGRSYGDVPPIRGVYRGAAEASVDAHVDMVDLDRSH